MRDKVPFKYSVLRSSCFHPNPILDPATPSASVLVIPSAYPTDTRPRDRVTARNVKQHAARLSSCESEITRPDGVGGTERRSSGLWPVRRLGLTRTWPLTIERLLISSWRPLDAR